MAMPMRLPIEISLPNGSTARVDGEVVLQQALDLLVCLHKSGSNYQDGSRREALNVIASLNRFARTLDIFNCCIAQKVPMAIMFALEDLDRGFTPRLFQKAKPARVARQSRREWCLKANAAGCLEVLIAAGVPDEEAKRFIAGVIGLTDFKLGHVNTSGANVVADWRKRFRENDNIAPDDLEAFRDTVTIQKAAPGEPMHSLKERNELVLLQMLNLCGYRKKRD